MTNLKQVGKRDEEPSGLDLPIEGEDDDEESKRWFASAGVCGDRRWDVDAGGRAALPDQDFGSRHLRCPSDAAASRRDGALYHRLLPKARRCGQSCRRLRHPLPYPMDFFGLSEWI